MPTGDQSIEIPVTADRGGFGRQQSAVSIQQEQKAESWELAPRLNSSASRRQERDRIWLLGGMDTSWSASSGVSTGSWRIFSRPLAFFSSEGMRSSHDSISARVRSAQASTVLSRLMKKSTGRALM